LNRGRSFSVFTIFFAGDWAKEFAADAAKRAATARLNIALRGILRKALRFIGCSRKRILLSGKFRPGFPVCALATSQYTPWRLQRGMPFSQLLKGAETKRLRRVWRRNPVRAVAGLRAWGQGSRVQGPMCPCGIGRRHEVRRRGRG